MHHCLILAQRKVLFSPINNVEITEKSYFYNEFKVLTKCLIYCLAVGDGHRDSTGTKKAHMLLTINSEQVPSKLSKK